MPIVIERADNRIWLQGWIGPRTPTMCKEVGGGRWSPSVKAWTFPLSMTTCRRLREVFGRELQIGRELNAWARAAVAEERELESLKSMEREAVLPALAAQAPVLEAALRPYQRAGIAFGSRLGTFGLFDQPGLGKTAMTIGAIIERGVENIHRPAFHLILAPKIAVETVWPAEVAKWTGDDAIAFALTGSRAKRESTLAAALDASAAHVFVCANIEMARRKGGVPLYPALAEVAWETVVVDESHRALIRKSTSTESQQRKGIVALRSRSRIALSGTPMRGKPQQLWGTLNWLRPDVYTSYWNFVGQFFKITSDRYSSHIIEGLKDGAEESMQRSIAPLVLRRTKAEVLPELPPKVYAGSHLIADDPNSPFGVWLTPSPKHAAQYRAFEAEASVVTEDGSEITAVGALAEYTRRSQLSSALHTIDGDNLLPTVDSVKLEWIFEKCEELGIPDEGRLVVASRFTKLINVFADELRAKGISCHVLTGETSTAERKRIVDDFQSETPSARVFLLNTMAGGVAVTLDAADDLVLVDESPVPDDQEQVEDRVHRASRMHNVTIHYLRCLGTQDEEIAWIAAARENVQKYLLDGARGVNYARKLYDAHAHAV